MKKGIVLLAGIIFLAACSSLPNPAISYSPVGGTPPLSESIVSFNVSAPVAARAIVNRFDHTIKLYFPAGTDITNLTIVIDCATGVSVSLPAAGPINLTNPVTYTLSDGSSYTAQAFATTPSAATVNSWLGTGINLGNDLDAWPGSEGSWTKGVAAAKKFFDDYKNMGFTSVRIPITWGASSNPSDRLSDNGPNSAVNASFMSRVDTVAGWALDAGLTVVINAHHEDWIRTKTGPAFTNQLPRFETLWTQIANHFKDWPPQLVFEILNEPHGDITNTEVKNLNSDILGKIRATNPTRVVIVGANSWNSITALQAGDFSLPSDSHLIATFHNYNPWNFAGLSQGSWGSSADIQSMANDLNAVASWAANKGVPLYMGEYGVIIQNNGTNTDSYSRTNWYRQVSALAKAKNISMVIWDDFGDFKIYDRSASSCDWNIINAVFGK